MKISHLAIALIAFPMMGHAERLVQFSKTNPVTFKGPQDLTKVATGLSADQFKLKQTKESLLGRHFRFQQVRNGIEVAGAELIVSTTNRGHVFQVYNNTSSAKFNESKANIPLISSEMAMENAWIKLRGNGDLLETPEASLLYQGDKLVYVVNLSASSPYGHYTVQVDAHSGNVLSVEDAALPRMKRAEVNTRTNAPVVSFSRALSKLENKNFKSQFGLNGILVNGTAQVFDPNPVVTLQRGGLEDTTELSVFRPAYSTQELKDISFVNGVYSLSGPKIKLIDFESPNVAPATSQDGSWMYERDNVAFNDAMTYLHIDRSVRYIESLGFANKRAIFPKTLEVDANGVQGADNSHYIPYSKRLAFGHGCVGDNEDADVILHELGHAIQDHMTTWSGGDTGAMGEGFGDYWAASYSASVANGNDPYPNWVYKWDGHNKCWPGRVLDATHVKYDPKTTYRAHVRIGSNQSDELWSTPIYQAFVELTASGAPREDLDKIILESHFGIGYGVKMPEMAQAIVNTARQLFPSKSYDQVYLRHFRTQNILQ